MYRIMDYGTHRPRTKIIMGLDKDAIANIQNHQQQAASLLLYQSVLTGDIGQTFLHLLDALIAGDELTVRLAYGEWFSALASHGQSWHRYLIDQILLSDRLDDRLQR